MRLEGRGRDLATDAAGRARPLATARLIARSGNERQILELEADPEPLGLGGLVGSRAGGSLRRAIGEQVPAERDAGSLVHLLLDDLAGCTLIGGFALFRWAGEPEVESVARTRDFTTPVGICSGYRPGASSLALNGTINRDRHSVAVAPPLSDERDPLGWHDLGPHPRLAMRRARRLDLWRSGDRLMVDSMWRDSCWEPDGTEIVVHEYRLWAEAAGPHPLLESVTAAPRVLPFSECPLAAPNAEWLIGTPIADLRRTVLDRLKGVDGCTHLNDALRALADVGRLAESLGDSTAA